MDIINLLPDSVANQIAAGEVVQRPASVVKELLENSIDAGAKRITLIVKGSGRTLIQVIDDGKGMSAVDARMCFERHATSKIEKASDLFSIRTKGFRGEALASIAAIAHVELISRQAESEVGTKVNIEGSKVTDQQPCQAPIGSSFAIKNLFYNVPARRKFLKSDAVEMKHIIEEFQRVALAHPDVAFELLKEEGQDVFNLPASPLRQRITGIFGRAYNEKLVPIEEKTDVIRLEGFIGKPEAARKTKGLQYFFLNDRFIKDSYLHHAVMRAYEDLLVERAHPSYFINLWIDPDKIDVNIHPTKTEVKFEDQKAIYAILSSAVRQSLGRYNIAPSLDFDADTSFSVPPLEAGQSIRIPEVNVDRSFNPFESDKASSSSSQFKREDIPQNWQELYPAGADFENRRNYREGEERGTFTEEVEAVSTQAPTSLPLVSIHGRYIMKVMRSGLMFIDKVHAHQRILFEQFIQSIAMNNGACQRCLFPETMDISAGEMEIIEQFGSEIKSLGFDIEMFGPQTIKISGVPADAVEMNTRDLIEAWFEEFAHSADGKKNKTELLARSLASKMAIAPGTELGAEEMEDLIDRLFGCEQPHASPSGRPTVVNMSLDELNKKFEGR